MSDHSNEEPSLTVGRLTDMHFGAEIEVEKGGYFTRFVLDGMSAGGAKWRRLRNTHAGSRNFPRRAPVRILTPAPVYELDREDREDRTGVPERLETPDEWEALDESTLREWVWRSETRMTSTGLTHCHPAPGGGWWWSDRMRRFEPPENVTPWERPIASDFPMVRVRRADPTD